MMEEIHRDCTTEKEKEQARDREREGECWRPVVTAITHQTSPPSPPHTPPPSPWKNKTVSWHRSWGEPRGGRGGKLGNQMWSIKTYWHAEGLPLPHSHTESTNSYSRPRYMHVCMSHRGCTGHTHTHMSSQKNTQRQILTCKQPCVHNQSRTIVDISKKWCLQKQMCRSHMHESASGFLIKHEGNWPKTCCSSWQWTRIWINHCWPKNVSRQGGDLQMGRHASVYGYASN